MEKNNKQKKKTFAKLVFRFFDACLCRSDFPFFGKISNKIRVFFARRISKGIDKKAFIDKGSFIDTNVVIKENGCVGKKCLISSNVTIGKNTMMGPEVLFFTSNHKKDVEKHCFVEGYEENRPIKIGDNCWIGQRSIILGGVEIGDFVTIGAGSVVTKDVPSNCLAAGNPAVVKKHYEK